MDTAAGIPIYKKPYLYLKSYFIKQYLKFYPPEMFVGLVGPYGINEYVSLCHAVLSKKYKTLQVRSDSVSVNNIPEPLLKITPSTKKIILEMDLKKPEIVNFYLSKIKPQTIVFALQENTSITESLDSTQTAIFNYDIPSSKHLASICKGNIIYYGLDSKNCAVWAGNLQVENFATTFELNLGVERVKVNFKLLGLHQVYAALAAAALGATVDMPLTSIKLSLETIEPSEHCLEAVLGPNGSVLLDDTVDSLPVGIDPAIEALLSVPARRRFVVLGEVKGLNGDSEDFYKKLAQKIYKEKLDYVFLGRGDTQYTAEELKSLGYWEDRLQCNLQNSQMVSLLLKSLGKGDVCLIKGPKVLRLDEVVKRIAKKV